MCKCFTVLVFCEQLFAKASLMSWAQGVTKEKPGHKFNLWAQEKTVQQLSATWPAVYALKHDWPVASQDKTTSDNFCR